MRFHFENIGPIKKAELELGDLTIIAGRNNTGKTYLVYTLYGFLERWRDEVAEYLMECRRERKAPFQSVDIRQAVRELVNERQYERQVTPEELNKERNAVISMLARQFSEEGIANVFSSWPDKFQGSSIEVSCDVGSAGDSLNSPIDEGDISISYDRDRKNLVFSAKPFGKRPSFPSRIERLVSFGYMRFLFMQFPTPFILSAERFGISLFYKELDFAKNRVVEFLQKMDTDKRKGRDRISPFLGRHTSRYALPIRDNIDYTRSISDLVKGRGPMQDAKLYDDVKNIMDGYYQSDENEIRFRSRSRKNRRFDIPLHLASSSARSLSDLYFYLRHKAEKNQLLIIDEPESHLDTRNQIMLARMLAHIVHAGIKVLVTTHSDYLLKEINNLAMLSSEFEGKEKFITEHGYDKREFFRRESLRGYVAEDGQLTRCRVDKFGFDMPVFDKTINEINAVSSELDSRLDDTEEE